MFTVRRFSLSSTVSTKTPHYDLELREERAQSSNLGSFMIPFAPQSPSRPVSCSCQANDSVTLDNLSAAQSDDRRTPASMPVSNAEGSPSFIQEAMQMDVPVRAVTTEYHIACNIMEAPPFAWEAPDQLDMWRAQLENVFLSSSKSFPTEESKTRYAFSLLRHKSIEVVVRRMSGLWPLDPVGALKGPTVDDVVKILKQAWLRRSAPGEAQIPKRWRWQQGDCIGTWANRIEKAFDTFDILSMEDKKECIVLTLGNLKPQWLEPAVQWLERHPNDSYTDLKDFLMTMESKELVKMCSGEYEQQPTITDDVKRLREGEVEVKL